MKSIKYEWFGVFGYVRYGQDTKLFLEQKAAENFYWECMIERLPHLRINYNSFSEFWQTSSNEAAN